MTIKKALQEMDNYYERMCACSSSSGRKYNGLAMLELVEKFPEIRNYWEIDTSYFHWENRFKKLRDYDDIPCDYTIENRGQADYTKLLKNITKNIANYRGTKPTYEDGINFTLPETSGLYLIGEITYNPEKDQLLYGIKVGKGSNLKKRIASYKTCGSTPYLCDYLIVPERDLNRAESMFHCALHGLCVALNGHNEEWFFFNKETYLEITSKGFAYFG